MGQSCCGLPAEMMGEKQAAREVALMNLKAMDTVAADYIVTLCASCASHLKKAYPRLLEGASSLSEGLAQFSEKVMPFSVFVNDVLKVTDADFTASAQTATYHAPCHLCRGLGVKEAPRALIMKAGFSFTPAKEEETCCGFGGTYSSKFPDISAEILKNKLADVKQTGADLLVTECPGCIMQLRGGAVKQGDTIEVRHLAEILAERMSCSGI